MNGLRVIRNGKMKKGRKYIEPMTGRGDKDVKKRDIKTHIYHRLKKKEDER